MSLFNRQVNRTKKDSGLSDRPLLCFDTFKKKLGKCAITMTEEEIRCLMEIQERAAHALFDMWASDKSVLK